MEILFDGLDGLSWDELASYDTNQQSAFEGTEGQQFYRKGRLSECDQ
jgi:hypothetical protein